MRIRNQPLRIWLGQMMLFSHSATLLASMAAPMSVHQRMQADCQGKSMTLGSKQNHCQQDCCKQAKHCSQGCISICMIVGLNMLPTTTINLLPHFSIKSINQSLMYTPDSTETTVLERPPKQTT
jgi:hypothetical protein